MLTEVNTSFPLKMNGDARAFIMRSAARLASFGSLISSSKTVNSSPPRRAIVKGDRSAQHPTKASIFMQHAVLALEVRSQAFLMSGNLLFDSFSIRVMNPIEPFFRSVADFAFLTTQHGLPARGEMHDVSRQIPVPQAIVGAAGRKSITLLTLLQRFLRMLV